MSKDNQDTKETQIKQREENIAIMRECIDDARQIVQEKRLLESQEVLATIAVGLFNSRIKKIRNNL